MLAEIDLLVAKANVARSMDASEPELSDAPEIRVERGRHPLLGERAVPQIALTRCRYAHRRHQRAEYGRQERRFEDGRIVRCDDVLRHAAAGRYRHARRPFRERDGRYRRRAVDRRQHVDVLGAPRAHARTPGRSQRADVGADRRNRRRHGTDRGGGAGDRDAGAFTRCGIGRHRDDACDRAEAFRARRAARRERERALRPRNLRAHLPPGYRRARSIAGLSAREVDRNRRRDRRAGATPARQPRTRLRIGAFRAFPAERRTAARTRRSRKRAPSGARGTGRAAARTRRARCRTPGVRREGRLAYAASAARLRSRTVAASRIRRASAAQGDVVAGRIALIDDCGYPSRSRHSPRGAERRRTIASINRRIGCAFSRSHRMEPWSRTTATRSWCRSA